MVLVGEREEGRKKKRKERERKKKKRSGGGIAEGKRARERAKESATKRAIEGCASNIVRYNPSLWDPGQTVFISFVYRGLHVRVSTMKHRTDVNVSRNRKPEHATLQVCARAWLPGGGAAVQNAKLSRMCSRPCLGSPPTPTFSSLENSSPPPFFLPIVTRHKLDPFK